MENTPDEFAMVTLSMAELTELRRILNGYTRSILHRKSRGDEVPAEKVELAHSLLRTVSDTLLEIETYDLIGDAMIDGTFEEVVKSWQSATGDHG
jgi:hypothetical protein